MKKTLTIAALAITGSTFAQGARLTKAEYVERWKATAIEQMEQYSVPASITLAQGILESSSGNSTLAVKGNNHFGIKCHGWTGKKMYKDDDAKDECFRVYKSAEESFEDHSVFLKSYDRYAFLFSYDVTNYKAWSKGLKKAGYATSNTYPQKLIAIIEDLNLDQYDKPYEGDAPILQDLIVSSDMYSNTHKVYIHQNKVKFVEAKRGDTFYKISKEFGLNLSQLHKYNDFDSKKDILLKGDVVYIQPKRRRNIFKQDEVVAKKEMSLEEFSQEHAANLGTLKRLNGFAEETIVTKGEVVTLR